MSEIAFPELITPENFFNIKDAVQDVAEHIHDSPMGLKSGIQALDSRICGFENGDYVVLAGRPSMGKTALACDIALNMSREATVAVFSLEMNARRLIERLLANLAQVNYHDWKFDRLNPRQQSSVNEAVDELSKRKLLIDDNSRLSPAILAKKLEFIQEEYGLDCVIVDYMQLMTALRGESRQQEISDISREIRALAKDFNIPFIILCQLNRSVEIRDSHRPRLADLRESGSIEQDAHKVLLLNRPSYYDMKINQSAEDTGEAEIIIAKNRSGPIGTVMCAWMREFMSFRQLELEVF